MMTTMMMGLETAMPTGVALFVAKTFAWLSLTVVAAYLSRKSPAAVRSWVWTLGLSGLLVLPALSFGLPAWAVLPAPALVPDVERSVVEQPAAEVPTATVRPTSEPAVPALQSQTPRRAARTPALLPRAQVTQHTPVTVEASQASARVSPVTLPSLPTVLFALWLLGAIAIAVPLVRASFHAARLRATGSRNIDPATREVFEDARAALGITRPIHLSMSDALRVPVTLGEIRPTILLPAEAANWPTSRVRNVLLHELAHIRRHDWATQWLGTVVRCVYWVNPLVWIAHRRQRIEAELACDDLVLSVGSRPSDYASDLVAVARTLRRDNQPALGLVAMARSTDLKDRVEAILDAGRSRGWKAMRWVAGGTLSALLVAIPIASAAPVEEVDEVDEVSNAMTTPAVESRNFSELDVGDPLAVITDSGVSEFGSMPIRSRTVALSVTPGTAPQQAACTYDGEGRHSTSVNGDDQNYRIKWETDYCSVEVEMRGDIQFSADDRGIERMSRSAEFDMEVKIGRDIRRVVAEPDGSGVAYRYWVDRDERSWDAEGQAWLAAVLPELFRHTTFNAEQRVTRILREGGPDAVFAEVERIHSDHVAGLYLELLMALADLSTAELGRVLDVAGAQLESDHQLGELLIAFADNEGLPEALRRQFLDATATLESDHQMGLVLERLLDEEGLSNDVLLEVLRAVDNIESDHQASQVLMRVPENYTLTGAQRAAFLSATRGIESDHQHGLVLGAFLDQGALSAEELADILDASLDLESDHQRSELLRRVAEEYTLTGPALTAFLRSTSEISSDHQLQMTAMAALDHQEMNSDQLALVFEIAAQIDSDHSATEVLLALIDVDGELPGREWTRMIEIMAGIDSDHSRGQIITVLIDSGDLDEARLVDVLGLLAETGSEHQVAEALVQIARTQTLGSNAREAFMQVAEALGSERQRDRAVAALVRNR